VSTELLAGIAKPRQKSMNGGVKAVRFAQQEEKGGHYVMPPTEGFTFPFTWVFAIASAHLALGHGGIACE
jgi:hypothetical protein